MKKSLLALSLTALLFSCKKETTPAAFTPTDLTGTAHIKGNTSKNVITPNGAGGWITTGRVPATGVNVTVRVPKSGAVGVGLYPNSNAQGSDVYTGQTDANGNYDISIKANGSGVMANIVIDGFAATLDTIINGVKKAGLYANYVGGTASRNAWSGQTSWFDYAFVASNLSTNPNNIIIGSATVTGSVAMSFVKKAVTTGTAAPTMTITNTNVPVPAGTKVYLDFTIDPLNLATKSYVATTDANGVYTFDVATVAAGTPGFPQNAAIWVADFARTRDTLTWLNGAATGTVTGKPGVFGSQGTAQGAIYNNVIRNAVNLTYSAGSFIPN
jgi:hypothetical protein